MKHTVESILPLVIFAPFVIWTILVFSFPAQHVQLGHYFDVFSQDFTLYIVFAGAALLAALMRQWSWWYWLGLASAVWLGIISHVNQPLSNQSGYYLQAFFPLTLLLLSRVLSSRVRPPLWSLGGLSWLGVLVTWPWILAAVTRDSYLPDSVASLLNGPSLLPGIATSAPLLLLIAAVMLLWFWRRLRSPSQPRQWAEFFIALQLVFAVLVLNTPESLQWMMLSVTLIAILGMSTQMLNLAYIDELTQIPGRRALYTDLAKLSRRSAVTMLDVDHFKKFNDNYGHDVGDQTLRLIASQLKRAKGFKCYRYGGEEFTLLFNHQDDEKISADLETVRQAIANYPVRIRQASRPRDDKQGRSQRGQQPAKEVRVTISLGCAIRQPQETEHQLIKRADSLLYQAKSTGRNCVVIE